MTMNSSIKSLFTLLVLVLMTSLAYAQGIAWDDLTEGQQRLLAEQQDTWNEFSAERQQNIARGAERWLEMNRGQRSRSRDRFTQWQGFSDQERANLRQRYETYRRLEPRDRVRCLCRVPGIRVRIVYLDLADQIGPGHARVLLVH